MTNKYEIKYRITLLIGGFLALVTAVLAIYSVISLVPDPSNFAQSEKQLTKDLNLLQNLVFFITVIGLVSYAFISISGYFLAKLKGYSGWIGFLLAINIIGYAVLLLLPDKTKK